MWTKFWKCLWKKLLQMEGLSNLEFKSHQQNRDCSRANRNFLVLSWSAMVLFPTFHPNWIAKWQLSVSFQWFQVQICSKWQQFRWKKNHMHTHTHTHTHNRDVHKQFVFNEHQNLVQLVFIVRQSPFQQRNCWIWFVSFHVHANVYFPTNCNLAICGQRTYIFGGNSSTKFLAINQIQWVQFYFFLHCLCVSARHGKFLNEFIWKSVTWFE